jgi:hypothetical protein
MVSACSYSFSSSVELPQSNNFVLSLLKERDELAQTVADYVRRLDELQSEGLMYRAQRRIDEREVSMLRRECEEKILIAKSEAIESRMMTRQLQSVLPPLLFVIF